MPMHMVCPCSAAPHAGQAGRQHAAAEHPWSEPPCLPGVDVQDLAICCLLACCPNRGQNCGGRPGILQIPARRLGQLDTSPIKGQERRGTWNTRENWYPLYADSAPCSTEARRASM